MKNGFLKKALFVLVGFILVSWTKPLPEVFLIGDSIAGHYRPYLEKYISNVARLNWKRDDGQAEKNLDVPTGSNGGDSRMVLEYLKHKMKDQDFKPEYLLLNCGLHDIKHEPKTDKIQIPEEDYKRNLEEIVRMTGDRNIKLVWIKTTWVVDSVHNPKQKLFYRYEKDVIKYNTIADEICRKYGIPSIDLHDFSKKQGIEQFIDHVHYKEPTRALQAAYIAGFLERILNEK